MAKQIINMKEWDRAEAFYIFKSFEAPYTNLCSDVDITNFMRFIRERDLHFYATLLFYMTKAANVIKEFRCRLEGDTPVIWDNIGVDYTLMQDSLVMGSNYTEFTDELTVFYQNVMKDIETAKRSGHMANNDVPGNVVYITSIPWTRLSNFSQAMYKVGAAEPYIGVGRRYGEGERIKLPIAVQAHHAFADGFHIAHYFNLVELMFGEPERYMDKRVPYDELLKKSRPFILSEKEKPFYAY